MLQNPLPNQGIVNTQPLAPPQANATTQQPITYAAPGQPVLDLGTHHFLMMSSDEVNLRLGGTNMAPPLKPLPSINPLMLIPLIKRYAYLHLH